jgi:serine/threonine protein kinase
MPLDNGESTRALKRRCRVCSKEYDLSFASCPHDGGPLDNVLEVGTHLVAAYSYDATLGKGGMGVIYKAHHNVIGRTVAIKMLTSSRLTDEDIHRFQREGKAIGRLHHPNIIHVFEFGVTEEGHPYMVMDYVEGTTLQHLIKKAGALSRNQSLDIADQICSAMDHAHAVGIVHRDLKPSNIMLEKNSQGRYIVKIVDFGIAKIMQKEGPDDGTITHTGEIFGSPTYMSPEQAQGKRADHRSDIYSIGCILYEMLSGVPPLQAESAMEMVLKQINVKPHTMKDAALGKEFSECLEFIVGKTLEKDASRRFQSCRTLRKALEDCAVGRFSMAEPKGRNRLPIALHATVVIIGIASIALFLVISVSENRMKRAHEMATEVPPTTTTTSDPDLNDLIERLPEIKGQAFQSLLNQAKSNDGQLSVEGLRLSDDDLKELSLAKYVRSITLKNNSVGDNIFPAIVNLPLQSVNLSGTYASPDGLKQLARIKTLKDLNLSNYAGSSRKLPSDVIAALSNLVSLSSLRLNLDDLHDEDVATLSKLKQLKVLDLGGNPHLTAECVKYIDRFPKLVSLNLEGDVPIHLQSILAIHRLSELQNLKAGALKNTDADIEELVRRAPHLEYLNMQASLLTNKGLISLANLKDLSELNIKACERLTPAGIEQFKKKLPSCTVNSEN